MMPTISIIDAMMAPDIWAPWFRKPAQWAAWRIFLKTLFGLPLTIPELKLYRKCTGRQKPRTRKGHTEAWLIIGRRGGKSFMLALIACFLAALRDWSAHLAPGERGTIPIICVDRRQARVVFRYCKALLTQVTALADLVERADNDTIDLTNGISIEIMTASFRSVRGYTVIAALCDEMAFWRVEETAANPDHEILDALRPAMATIPGAMLLVASSPYAKRGALYEADRKHYGQEDDPALVWRCDTLTMHDSSQVRAVIDRAFEDDPVKAASEFGRDGDVVFRPDIESFIGIDAIDAVTIPGRRELPYVKGIRYIAAVDPSSGGQGGGGDSMTLAIAHRDKDGKAVLDLLRERRPPFSPAGLVDDYAAVVRSYGVHKVHGDRWGGEFCREPFRQRGVEYAIVDRPKSDFYAELAPIINSAKVELLEHQRLAAQFTTLERRTVRSGKDSIDHCPGAHDDVVNVAAIAIVLAAQPRPAMKISPAAMAWAAGLKSGPLPVAFNSGRRG
jgi:hypothetical protein